MGYIDDIANQQPIRPDEGEYVALYITKNLLRDPIVAATYKGAMEQLGHTILRMKHDIYLKKIALENTTPTAIMSELIGGNTSALRTARHSEAAQTIDPQIMFRYLDKQVARNLPVLLDTASIAQKERSGLPLTTITPEEISNSADEVARISKLPMPSQIHPEKMIVHLPDTLAIR
jgi:hypothetical protein